ncbi:hypothetical protein Gotur_017641, partial [Gossypium turneri]
FGQSCKEGIKGQDLGNGPKTLGNGLVENILTAGHQILSSGVDVGFSDVDSGPTASTGCPGNLISNVDVSKPNNPVLDSTLVPNYAPVSPNMVLPSKTSIPSKKGISNGLVEEPVATTLNPDCHSVIKFIENRTHNSKGNQISNISSQTQNVSVTSKIWVKRS